MTTSTVRTKHLIDIENLLGGRTPGVADVAALWNLYRGAAIGVETNDAVIVASSRHFARTVWFGLPLHGIQRRIRDGIDGADLELIDAFDASLDSRSFNRLVIASGDHSFAPIAATAREHGMDVHQVIGWGVPSRDLMALCPSRTWLGLGAGSGLRAYREHRYGPRPGVRALPARRHIPTAFFDTLRAA